MAEKAPNKIHVERAGNRLPEKQGFDRQARSARGSEGPRRKVMPGRVHYNVRDDRLSFEHVAPGSSPKREIEQ
jgi:hypothetical protein